MLFVSEIQVAFATGSLKWSRTINEKDRAINCEPSYERSIELD